MCDDLDLLQGYLFCSTQCECETVTFSALQACVKAESSCSCRFGEMLRSSLISPPSRNLNFPAFFLKLENPPRLHTTSRLFNNCTGVLFHTFQGKDILLRSTSRSICTKLERPSVQVDKIKRRCKVPPAAAKRIHPSSLTSEQIIARPKWV